MNANQNQGQPLLPDADTAFQNVFGGVYERVFFNKCAAFGWAPQSREQAQGMLELAAKLRAANEQAAVKQAAAADDPVAFANAALDQALAQRGINLGVKEAEEEAALDGFAAELADDPTLYNSVLTLKAAEVAQYQAQLAGRQGQ